MTEAAMTTDDDDPLIPEWIAKAFGGREEIARDYAQLLTDQGVLRGLIGPSEVGRLWSRHILNCAVIGELIGESVSVVDVGSGAGLPGIPLAIARPDLNVVLVEPLLRRTTFLEEAVASLQLNNVTVLRGRAEEKAVVSEVGEADVVTSRAVAPLDRLAKWSAPLLRRGGRMVAIKGSRAPEEVTEHAAVLHRLGLESVSTATCGEFLPTPTTAVIAIQSRVPRGTSKKKRR